MLKRLLYLILVLPMACVDPYEVEVPEGAQLLTVEGIISTGPGPHAITITRSATYGSIFEGLNLFHSCQLFCSSRPVLYLANSNR